MDSSSEDRVDLRPGMQVVTLDDQKLGKVVSLNDAQLIVEKGFFFPHDHVIPMSAVESADDETIYLNLNKEDALNQNWATGATGAAYDEREVAPEPLSASDDLRSSDLAQSARGEAMTIPVHEEELIATKRPVEAGQVQINKQVVSEDRTLDVPITEERVRVTRRVVDRAAAGDAAPFAGGTIEVPVRTEAVDVGKRVRVAEEVEVAKEAVQKTQPVAGTVRREVVDVQDPTSANVSDGTSGAGTTGSPR